MQSPPGPETVIDGIRYLYFAGTSYLGLAAHPDVIEAGCTALRRYGVHSATTRALVGTNPPIQEVEQRAAQYFGTEDAFYFGSGYMANHILVSALRDEVEAVAVDESAHYCLLEAARLAGKDVVSFRARDADDLARVTQGFSRVLVMCDAVGSSSGRLAPVHSYLEVLREKPHSKLLLDDAHGFGVLGPHGRGWLDELGLWSHVNGGPPCQGVSLFVSGTLAKALGGFGGILPGTRQFLTRARSSSHYFDGASAPPSAIAGATAKALEIASNDPTLRSRLGENAVWLRQALEKLGLEVPPGATAHFGVTIGDRANMLRIHNELKARRIFVPFVAAYSGIPQEGLLRFAVFATHTQTQLETLVNALQEIVPNL